MDAHRAYPFFVALSLAVLSPSARLGAQPAPEKAVLFTVGDDKNVVRVGRRTPEGLEAAVIFTAANLPADVKKGDLTLTDANLESTATTVTMKAGGHMSGDAVDTWLVTVTAKALPANATERHVLAIAFQDKRYRLAYTLTDRPATAATFTVAPPPSPWLLRWDGARSPLAVTVTTGDQPITGLRVAQSTLREAGGLVQVGPEDFGPLCAGQDCSIPARSTRTFEMRLDSTNHQPHGKFTGTVSFAIDQIADLQAVPVTLHGTSTTMAIIGGLALLSGLWLASYVRGLKPIAAHAQALRPVLALRTAVGDVRRAAADAVRGTTLELPGIAARLDDFDRRLSTDTLEGQNLLPARHADAFGLSADAAARLQAHLAKISAELGAVAVLVHQGAAVLGRRWPSASEDARQHTVTKAAELDAFATGVATAEAATAKLPEFLVPPPQPDIGELAPGPGPIPEQAPGPVTVEEATFTIERASDAAWWIWGATSFVTGLAALIVPNAGFGTAMDLITCFLWGLGVTTAGTTLQSMTPSTVATSIGVGIPKSGQTP
jgi:hypothetical protein